MEGIFQKEESPHDKEQTMPRASAPWEQAQDRGSSWSCVRGIGMDFRDRCFPQRVWAGTGIGMIPVDH